GCDARHPSNQRKQTGSQTSTACPQHGNSYTSEGRDDNEPIDWRRRKLDDRESKDGNLRTGRQLKAVESQRKFRDWESLRRPLNEANEWLRVERVVHPGEQETQERERR